MSIPRFDAAQVAQLVRDIAATEIMPRFRALAAHEVREKKPGDLVTVADEAAEGALIPALQALLPGSIAIGEEAIARDPDLLRHLDHAERPVWLIDPVDGTVNFAHGRPLFAVLLALVVGGRTVAGWIHDPLTGTMAAAESGSGAWDGERRLSVADPVPPELMRGQIPPRLFSHEGQYELRKRGIVFHHDPEALRCAGQEYLRLVTGAWHFTGYGRLRPWDHAAGILVHQEAGGFSAYLADRTPYHVRRGEGPVMTAPSAECWDALLAYLRGFFKKGVT
ncbi:MAG TPA: inositol monophosphatase family protein [Alphaproteobacteria bacterium]|jgi:fructose-1,6-bisphosphatase/inositol monophosphatase family enzyme|nr:inositol monophosphatase family protein [Alphaproteobacteria bacterium]